MLLVSRIVLGCALIVLFAIDLEHHLLPNVITLPGIVVGFAFSLVTEPGWLASLIGITVGPEIPQLPHWPLAVRMHLEARAHVARKPAGAG